MKEEKLVSIIIPTYKRSNLLDRTIKLLLEQNYKNIEIIVVDDNNPQTVYREKTEDIMKKKDIENVGGKIAGVVINKVPVSVAKYESSYYYGSTAMTNTPRKKEPEREFYTNDSSRITKAKKEDILNQLDEFLKDK